MSSPVFMTAEEAAATTLTPHHHHEHHEHHHHHHSADQPQQPQSHEQQPQPHHDATLTVPHEPANEAASPSEAATADASPGLLSPRSAAVKIQAQFRGHLQRKSLTPQSPNAPPPVTPKSRLPKKSSSAMGNPAHWPYNGPLAPHILPHKPKELRNPIFAGMSTGTNTQCGCPGPSQTHTIHFEVDGLPPQLWGIYTEAQWHELMHELNEILHSTHLPLCPSSLCCLLPILGACGWYCWRENLHARRALDLRKAFHEESERLRTFGLRWIVVPMHEGNRPGRGEISGYVIELVLRSLMAEGLSSVHPRSRRLQLTESAPAEERMGDIVPVPQSAPAEERMGDIVPVPRERRQSDTAPVVRVNSLAASSGGF